MSKDHPIDWRLNGERPSLVVGHKDAGMAGTSSVYALVGLEGDFFGFIPRLLHEAYVLKDLGVRPAVMCNERFILHNPTSEFSRWSKDLSRYSGEMKKANLAERYGKEYVSCCEPPVLLNVLDELTKAASDIRKTRGQHLEFALDEAEVLPFEFLTFWPDFGLDVGRFMLLYELSGKSAMSWLKQLTQDLEVSLKPVSFQDIPSF
ncbi:hypothetical protein [Aliiroseovarius halocynthiae]|uniref:Uncharacterized protein n=1 Tax=Aliiroseovarius halocynthiae TaxID=985055 RepID=A0A545SLD1_9RHOB|nr:hypothetical protein [Aliiroseovarius halocynthiae]TQV65785.1 hypothetical protein FIL88_15920 [Aliiroseovarius halocynthiae]